VLLNTANDEAHGSARSIDGFDIHEAFNACGEHLLSHGGHAMAAGCRLAHEQIGAFRDALVEYAHEHISEEQLTAVLGVDAEARLTDLSRDAVEQIERLAPFGRDNPRPVLLLRGLSVAHPPRTMGQRNNHLQLMLEGDGATMRCVAWNRGEWAERLRPGTEMDLAAHVKLNHWNGRTNVELEACDWRVAEGAAT
jgi:single-stranded-DNA-specific exonuclease